MCVINLQPPLKARTPSEALFAWKAPVFERWLEGCTCLGRHVKSPPATFNSSQDFPVFKGSCQDFRYAQLMLSPPGEG